MICHYEEIDSYETLHILNYFGFPINGVDEEDFWGKCRKEFGYDKYDEYPMLVINSAHEEMPGAELAGKEQILTYLFNHDLIGTFRSYSVYEKQGLALIEDKLEPAVNEVLKDWKTLAQFHMKPKQFKQAEMSIEGHDMIKVYMYKMLKFV